MADWMISNWMVWLIAACAVVILEISTGTFYLLMIALGLAAGAIAAWLGADMPMQLVAAAIVGAIATFALRRSKYGSTRKIDPARNPNVNLDIGQTVNIDEWRSNGGGKSVARVSYRGAPWDIELEHGGRAQPGVFVIRELRGSRLIVNNASE